MTSNQEKCGLGSIFPMSCRERTEAFARHLHSRLSSLNSEEGSDLVNETTWIAPHENSITLSQPKHASRFVAKREFGFDSSEAVDSTEEELKTKLGKLVYKRSSSGDEEKNLCNDSDSSDDPFYDTQSDVMHSNPENVNLTGNPLKKCNQRNEKNVNISDPPLNNNDVSCLKCDSNSLSVLNETHTNDTDHTPLLTEQLEKNDFPPIRKIDKIDEGNDDDDDDSIPRVRRCSSLKIGKTPPGTPGEKKIVRFADALGLDLTDVRTFLDEIPKIPNSAFSDLKEIDSKSSTESLDAKTLNQNNPKIEKLLTPLFQQPGGQINFLDRVRENQVCLENAIVGDPISFLIRGIVKVRNLDFHKSVHVRYTLDSWSTFADVQAEYIENSCDGFSDKFSFALYANKLAVGKRLEFAIRFQCKGCQYWDNNYGKNYSFECLPSINKDDVRSDFVPDDVCSASFY